MQAKLYSTIIQPKGYTYKYHPLQKMILPKCLEVNKNRYYPPIILVYQLPNAFKKDYFSCMINLH